MTGTLQTGFSTDLTPGSTGTVYTAAPAGFVTISENGLITAVALVRPSRSLYDLEPSSVKKKWKDKAFAAGTSRTEMEHAAQEFGVELWEHVGNVIAAMRKIAPELGLEGNIQKP